ncbi:MAG: bifunctional response regulator/alkaline phosphatase family protein [Bacteroidetes bacterium]|nr:bifunctional response regulator/alkaline phosphatase family protein [Bacteroidota bacterium]
MASLSRILWADDEIDLLRPHILFLESRGYQVTSVTNGADALEQVRRRACDLVLLDEQMPGMGGLETLQAIKDIRADMPVVMITKSEEECIMEEALGGKISDYLTKPVNPSQVLLTCKRILDGRRIEAEKASQNYLQSFGGITAALMNPLDHAEWVDLYQRLIRYDVELDADEGVRQVFEDQVQEANRSFCKYVEKAYPTWIAAVDRAPDAVRPTLSHEVIPQWVLPEMGKNRPVIFFVIDCMRWDQWLEFERLLAPLFHMQKDYHFSLLPTATPYSRNSIFSGLLPRDLAKRYPRIWAEGEDDEHSRNRNEEQFLNEQLERRHIKARVRYDKLIGTKDGRDFQASVHDLLQSDLSAVVVNFVDILAHSRSDSAVLKEIAPDERAYRALTRTWFEHSWLFQAFQQLASTDCTLVITTDHGAIRSLHETKVVGDRETSTALRYKYGRNLKCDERHAVFVKDPETFGLPAEVRNTNFIIAKEDYYFVYPTNYNHYVNKYRDTMQHGGISLEEMILPVITLRPRAGT